MSKEIPVEMKVTDLTGKKSSATIIWPNADAFDFVVGLPPSTSSSEFERVCPEFKGFLRVLDNDQVVEEYEINSTIAQRCNWLMHNHNLHAFILTWSFTNSFSDLQPRKMYNIQIEFNDKPDEIASLWLHFLQPGYDRSEQSPGGESLKAAPQE